MKRGFTLAETLIALAIIGVVAGLMIPTTIGNFQKKSLILSIKKNYSDLTQNIDMFANENYNKKFAKTTLGKGNVAEFYRYFDITTKCMPEECFASSYSSLNGSEVNNSDIECSDVAIMLKNGASLCATVNASDKVTITLDTNGKDGPNIGGRDMFTFYIYSDYYVGDRESYKSDACESSAIGLSCLQKLINDNWQMNY